ncbi:MAG: CoA transferase, partial [Deltaproteobacteria bacterium]|nr:CoA transferase [Deltaproteobacteria bacterium]
RTLGQWIEIMANADACCEPVLKLDEAVQSPLAEARSMANYGPDGKRFLGCPLKLSESLPSLDEPAPALGQHTRDILAQVGITDEEMQSLASEGVI